MALKRFGGAHLERRLIVAVCFLAAAAAPRIARAGVYDVTYYATIDEGCTISCIDFPPGVIETATFALPDADLLTPGSYDVSASYSNPWINSQTTPTALADAIVAGGVVTDLTVNLAGSYPTPAPFTGDTSQDLSASGGDFSQSSAFSAGSFFAEGTYSITEQPTAAPEPGTMLLLGAGLLAGVAIRSFVRRTPKGPKLA